MRVIFTLYIASKDKDKPLSSEATLRDKTA